VELIDDKKTESRDCPFKQYLQYENLSTLFKYFHHLNLQHCMGLIKVNSNFNQTYTIQLTVTMQNFPIKTFNAPYSEYNRIRTDQVMTIRRGALWARVTKIRRVELWASNGARVQVCVSDFSDWVLSRYVRVILSRLW
jgi:hypothetical protein